MIGPGEVSLATLLDVERDGKAITVVAYRKTRTQDATGGAIDLTAAEYRLLDERFLAAERLDRDQAAAARSRPS